jgi:threonylcarbamoyladenosine tRNA methylthiotransferase MtaB
MKISFFTLGCKLNQAETDELKTELLKLGFFVVPFSQKADVSVIRACGVTEGASRTTREMIRNAKRRGAYIIATGCMENRNMPEIDFVAMDNKHVIDQIVILSEAKDPFNLEGGILRCAQNDSVGEPTERTRAFIKIQTGCNFNCSYCIIPHFRGHSGSIPAETIIENINKKVEEGFNEAVLTGVNICQYQDKKLTLAGLLKKILLNTKIVRVRLGSLDPRLITEDLIKLYSDKKTTERLMPHWHLSLQSGSDTILKSMNRLYSAKKYYVIVAKLRKSNPLFSFTTDVIVGFPGETESDFKQTCGLVKKAQFAKVHVFPFSARPETAAENMKQIPDKTKKERSKKMILLSEETAKKFAEKFIGKIRPVLFENKKTGYTPEFIRIKNNSKKNLQNKIVKTVIRKSNLQL